MADAADDGAERKTSLSLLERARAQDPQAWRRLLDLYGPLIYHWCRRSGLRGDDAVSISQERLVFRRALERIRGEFEEKTWLAFWRSAVDGLDTAAIAAELSMSPCAIRKAKSRVLRRLRKELGDLGPPNPTD